MSEKSDYDTLIERSVVMAVQQGARSFSEICLATRGAFPADVLAALRRLGFDDELFPDISARTLNELHENWWPEPSPVDYEWRFTFETAQSIATIALGFGQRVLCLGTPTVFRSLFLRGTDTDLVDRNPLIVRALSSVPTERIHIADISNYSLDSERSFDVIVMDPPWYPDHVRHWLSIASEVVSDEGTIIFTLFPELTRPGAELERAVLLSGLAKIGTYEVSPGSVSYVTPLFERETLSALGVPPLPQWRTADLVTLRVSPTRDRLEPTAPPSEFEWEHFLFGTQVVAIKRVLSDTKPITVASPYDDRAFLLRSVSSRDPVRSTIGLWTSRNRVARLTGNARIAQFLRALEHGVTCDHAIDQIAETKEESAALEMIVALIGW